LYFIQRVLPYSTFWVVLEAAVGVEPSLLQFLWAKVGLVAEVVAQAFLQLVALVAAEVLCSFLIVPLIELIKHRQLPAGRFSFS
jgi:hypothetical protein